MKENVNVCEFMRKKNKPGIVIVSNDIRSK